MNLKSPFIENTLARDKNYLGPTNHKGKVKTVFNLKNKNEDSSQ